MVDANPERESAPGLIPPGATLRSTQRLKKAFVRQDSIEKMLVLIPGSKSLGKWCSEVEAAAATENWGVTVKIVVYTPPAVWWVAIWPPQLRRNRQIRRQLDQLLDTAAKHEAEVFIAAHSYGTHALIKYLRRFLPSRQDVDRTHRLTPRINAIFLINGIAKRKHLAEIRPMRNLLINDVASFDNVPLYAAGLATPLAPCWNPYDDIGTRGVQSGAAEAHDRFFPGDHGTLVTVDHFRSHILPVLYGDELPPGTAADQTTNMPVLSLPRLRRIRTVLSILGYTALAVLIGWAIWSWPFWPF